MKKINIKVKQIASNEILFTWKPVEEKDNFGLKNYTEHCKEKSNNFIDCVIDEIEKISKIKYITNKYAEIKNGIVYYNMIIIFYNSESFIWEDIINLIIKNLNKKSYCELITDYGLNPDYFNKEMQKFEGEYEKENDNIEYEGWRNK